MGYILFRFFRSSCVFLLMGCVLGLRLFHPTGLFSMGFACNEMISICSSCFSESSSYHYTVCRDIRAHCCTWMARIEFWKFYDSYVFATSLNSSHLSIHNLLIFSSTLSSRYQ